MSRNDLDGTAQDESGPARMGRSWVRVENEEDRNTGDEEPDASENLWRPCDDDGS
jgi:hypothetical protein